MDYVVGSVAALVTGNVTPSRPRITKRALTPTKHQPSPNVTPKSEFVDDRSIFLSPSVQKKKAIVKKSPKRIFQNPDLETTEDNLSLTSPKADKVKKHLKDDLDSDMGCNKNSTDAKSPKLKGKNKKESVTCTEKSISIVNEQGSNENTPKKKKKNNNSFLTNSDIPATEMSEGMVAEIKKGEVKSPKNMKQRRQSVIDPDHYKENASDVLETEPKTSKNSKSPTKQKNNLKNTDNVIESNSTEVTGDASNVTAKKKNKKRKKKPKQNTDTVEKSENEKENVGINMNVENDLTDQGNTKKKNRKRKKSKSEQNKAEPMEVEPSSLENATHDESTVLTKKSKTIVNPNAITHKESDSEHESDDEIESENEEINKKVFAAEPMADESTDDDEEKTKENIPQNEKVENKEVEHKGEVNTENEIKRTLFVGNVPFSAKCKKEIKKIFNKHGQIETIRIRTVPVKDGRYTPKLAVIKNELHPERTTVNVYVKYADEESVEKALAENNTLLNDHHLRVSRSSSTGAEHDPKCSIFVGNLPFAIEDETLRQKFENCGEIESVRIIRDKKTNAGKGFGYVNFTSKDAVELALALTEEDLTIKNRIMRVKRCTQLTNKQKQPSDKGGFKKSLHQRQNQGNQRPNQGYQRSNLGNQRQNQGNWRPQSGQRQHPANQRDQSGQRQNQFNQRVQTGERQNQGSQTWNQGFQRDNQGGQRHGNKDEAGQDGAHRRIMQKRKSQDASGGDGPPNKRQNINQPNKEKKTRKEFVGMTAEKKKKHKFDKGQKKKKALSEILTK